MRRSGRGCWSNRAEVKVEAGAWVAWGGAWASTRQVRMVGRASTPHVGATRRGECPSPPCDSRSATRTSSDWMQCLGSYSWRSRTVHRCGRSGQNSKSNRAVLPHAYSLPLSSDTRHKTRRALRLCNANCKASHLRVGGSASGAQGGVRCSVRRVWRMNRAEQMADSAETVEPAVQTAAAGRRAR